MTPTYWKESLRRIQAFLSFASPASFARITAEQMQRRPATLPELDDQPFDQWLGDVSPDTHRFFDRWCQNMNSGSAVDVPIPSTVTL